MHKRMLQGPLTAVDVRRFRRAVREASRAGTPLNMMLTIHPGRLEQPPSDVAGFFQRKVIAWLGDWHRRQGQQWSAVWVRENYLAHHREHLHMLLHVPKRLQGKLARALTRRWPEPGVVDLRPVYDEKGAVSYIIKQLTSQAHFAVGRRVRREQHCRHDRALVAEVLGLRANMTRDLERLVRRLELEAARVQADEPAATLPIDRGAGGCHCNTSGKNLPRRIYEGNFGLVDQRSEA